MAAAPPIVPPIVIVELPPDSDLMFFRSEGDVLGYLEPWYPGNVDYRAFDSQGRRLELYAEPPVVRKHVVGPIWTDNAHKSTLFIRATEEEPSGASELATMLRERSPGVEPDPQLAFGELLEKAAERVGFS